MSRVIGILSLGAIGLVGFVYSKTTIDPTLAPRIFLLSLTVFVIGIAILVLTIRKGKTGQFSCFRMAIVPVMILYLLFGAISLTVAANATEGLAMLIRMVLSTAVFLVALWLLTSLRRGYAIFARLAAVIGVVLSIIAIGQYYNVAFYGIPGHAIPYATMANKNLLSSALFLLMPFALFVWLESHRFWKWPGVVSMALMLHIVLVSQTRSVWAAMAAAVLAAIVIGLVLWRKGRDTDQSPLLTRLQFVMIAGTLVTVVAVSFAVLSIRTAESATDEIRPVVNMSTDSMQERLALWEKSVSMAADNPVLGVGLDNWKLILPGYSTEGLRSESGDLFFLRPHNDFLWVLCETGPIGLVSYLAIFGLALFYGIRIVTRSTRRDERLAALLLMLGVVGFLVISFFSFPRERVFHTTFIMLTIAVPTALYARLKPADKEIPRSIIVTGLLFVMAAGGLGMTYSISRFYSEKHTKRAVYAKSLELWDAVEREASRALTPLVTLDPTSVPIIYYRGVARFNLGRTDEAMGDFQIAYTQNPHHVRLLNNLGTCYEVGGDHRKAIAFYERALAVSPYFENTLINMAASYHNLGDYQEAYDYLLKVKQPHTDPRYPQFLEVISSKLERDAGQ